MKSKKIILILLAVILLLSTLSFASCGNNSGNTSTTAGTNAVSEPDSQTGSESAGKTESGTDEPMSNTTEPVSNTDAPTETTEKKPDDPNPDITKIAVIAGGGADTKIYVKMVAMANKTNPRVVILTTAGKDAVGTVNSYVNTFKELTNDVEAITLCTKLYGEKELHDLICNADIICEVGGQTEFMQEVWAKFKVDEYLVEAYNNGVIVCGGSAGGMCWTYAGWNDFINLPESDYKFYYGLDLIHVYYGPHFASGEKWLLFDGAIKAEKNPKYNIGYGMENGTALVFINGVAVEAVRENTSAHIYTYTFSDGAWTRAEYKY